MGKKDKKDKKKDKGSSKALTKTFKGLGKLIYTLVVFALIGGVILYAYNAGWFDKAREAAEQLIAKVTHRADDALKAIAKEAIPLADATYTAAEQPKTIKLPLVSIEPKGTFVIGGFHLAEHSFQSINLPANDKPLALSTNDKATGLATLKLDGYDGKTLSKADLAPKEKDEVFLVHFATDNTQHIIPAHIGKVTPQEGKPTTFIVSVDRGSYDSPAAVVNKDGKLIGVITSLGTLDDKITVFNATTIQ